MANTYWWKRAYYGKTNKDSLRIWDLYLLADYLSDKNNDIYRTIYDFNDIGNDFDNEYITANIKDNKRIILSVENGNEYDSNGKIYIKGIFTHKTIISPMSHDSLVEIFTLESFKITQCKYEDEDNGTWVKGEN